MIILSLREKKGLCVNFLTVFLFVYYSILIVYYSNLIVYYSNLIGILLYIMVMLQM